MWLMMLGDQSAVRSAFVNASKSRRASATFPATWPPDRIDDRDFVGWQDPKAPQRAYLHVGTEVLDDPVTLELRLATTSQTARSTLCDWCHTQEADGGARLMVAARAGSRRGSGDTVGLYVCADFDCSLRARTPLKGHQISVSGAPDERVPELRDRIRAFVDRVVE